MTPSPVGGPSLRPAAGRKAPVKWQFVGPVTLGLALVRAGLETDVAFEVSVRAVRCRVRQLVDHVAKTLPGCRQVVFIDEPTLDELMAVGFPIAPDTAVDLVSAALAAIEPVVVTGLHVCATADIASLVAIGPDVLSVPVDERLVESAGYLARFLGDGGTVAGVPSRRRAPSRCRQNVRGAGSASCGASSWNMVPIRRSCASSRSSLPSAGSARTPRPSPNASTGWPPNSANASATSRWRRASR
jgi:hypothetical protein